MERGEGRPYTARVASLAIPPCAVSGTDLCVPAMGIWHPGSPGDDQRFLGTAPCRRDAARADLEQPHQP
eukprot:13614560-Alexandrium_andersonii.AAC.1